MEDVAALISAEKFAEQIIRSANNRDCSAIQ